MRISRVIRSCHGDSYSLVIVPFRPRVAVLLFPREKGGKWNERDAASEQVQAELEDAIVGLEAEKETLEAELKRTEAQMTEATQQKTWSNYGSVSIGSIPKYRNVSQHVLV